MQAPASDVTRWDTGLSPAPTPGHPTNLAPPANNGDAGKWSVLRHYPPKLRVHLRPNNNGPGTRLRGPGTQTMVPRMRQEMIQLCLNYFSDGAQAPDPKSTPYRRTLSFGQLARWPDTKKVSFLIDTVVVFSLLTSFKGPLQPSKVPLKASQASLFIPR